MLAGAAVSGASSILGGQSQKAGYDQQANAVQLEARQKAAAIRRLAKQTIASARADYAASGVDVNQGSPTVVQRDIVYNSEVDALNAIASGNSTADALRKSGSAASNAGFLQAGGTALSAYGAYLAFA